MFTITWVVCFFLFFILLNYLEYKKIGPWWILAGPMIVWCVSWIVYYETRRDTLGVGLMGLCLIWWIAWFIRRRPKDKKPLKKAVGERVRLIFAKMAGDMKQPVFKPI